MGAIVVEKNILGLDGIRGIAFILVFLFHLGFLSCGWIGVQMFFVLSGFLITRVLLRMKEKYKGNAFFWIFYFRRFLRIFPVYYFYLISFAFISKILIDFNLYPGNRLIGFQNQLPYALAYFHNFFHATVFFSDNPFISHFWSLSVEEQFYLVWPLLVFSFDKNRLKSLLVGLIVFSPIFRLLNVLFVAHYHFSFLSPHLYGGINYVLPWSHFDAFAWGALLNFSLRKTAAQEFFWLTLFIPLLGFLFTESKEFYGNLSAWGFPQGLRGFGKFIWGYSMFNYYFYLLLSIIVVEKRFISFLENPFLKEIGKLSYGLYIFHYPVIGVLKLFFSTTWLFIGGCFFSWILAKISYYYLEFPFLKLKDRFNFEEFEKR